MGLRLKFNFVLFFVFAAGIAASSYISHLLLQESAKQEVLRDAGLVPELNSFESNGSFEPTAS